MLLREVRRWIASILATWLLSVIPEEDTEVLLALAVMLRKQIEAKG